MIYGTTDERTNGAEDLRQRQWRVCDCDHRRRERSTAQLVMLLLLTTDRTTQVIYNHIAIIKVVFMNINNLCLVLMPDGVN